MTSHHFFVIVACGTMALLGLGIALVAFKLPIEPTRTTKRASE